MKFFFDPDLTELSIKINKVYSTNIHALVEITSD